MDLTTYMSRSIQQLVGDTLKATVKNPRESAFVLKYLHSAKSAAGKRDDSEARGLHIPPFLIASIASRCNLFCSGCYARANSSCGAGHEEMSCADWENIFAEAGRIGVSFILLAGGEPLMRKDVLEAAAEHPEIIFPVFTNGTLIGEEYLRLFDRCRNLVPVLSLEGGKTQTDQRRGEGTYDCLARVMDQMKKRGIFFGTSLTVTTQNIGQVTADDFIALLRGSGCGLAFYVEYVPVDGVSDDLALSDSERAVLESCLAGLRARFENMLFLSFPGDEKETGGCLAAGRGFFHINASGGAEPCPFSPFSDFSLKDHTLTQALSSPLFYQLRDRGLLDGEHDGGCTLFAREKEVRALLSETQ